MSASFDIAAIRREFPITQRSLYFDSAHQAPLSVCVKAALEKFYAEGLETAGPKSRWLARVEDVRARLARLIGADPSEIAFTKNTSEGLNIAANALPLTAGDNVLLVEGDHPNNAYAFLNLRAKGVDVRFVPMGRAGRRRRQLCSLHRRAHARHLAVARHVPCRPRVRHRRHRPAVCAEGHPSHRRCHAVGRRDAARCRRAAALDAGVRLPQGTAGAAGSRRSLCQQVAAGDAAGVSRAGRTGPSAGRSRRPRRQHAAEGGRPALRDRQLQSSRHPRARARRST